MHHHNGTGLPELTLRGMVLGALITVVFTASNVYLGLKVGLTFSSAIPAAVISMAVLRFFSGANILENNMVQTQASAAGTLSAIIFILPGLVMMGHWHGFPFWQTLGICAAGGMLGVMFSIPLRRVMVVQSGLPYPEGVAAAEILRVGSADAGGGEQTRRGLRDILFGGVLSAGFSLAASGLKVFAENMNLWFSAGASVLRLPVGFSLALVGAGYMIGIVSGVAILIGLVIAWGIAVPYLTAVTPRDAGTAVSAFASGIWSSQVRFMGAGMIGVSAVWTLATLFKPMLEGVKVSLSTLSRREQGSGDRTDQDMSPAWIIAISLAMIALLAVVFASFLSEAPVSLALFAGLIAYAVAFAFIFGFLVAAACGYMAGLIGSSSSPISGIGIVAVILVSLLLLASGAVDPLLATPQGGKLAIAIALFVTAAIIAVAAIANDNLQDLKTGQLVGATPWRQQVALLVGCAVGAAVIPPVLNLLYNAYGFTGALPREGMDAAQALAAPQATLMTAIATGIFTRELNWTMLVIGVALGVVLIAADWLLARRGGVARLPVLAVGIGIYLPPTVSMALFFGAVLGWLIDGRLRQRAAAAGQEFDDYAERPRQRGILVASGLIVGESLVGVLLAALIGFTGKDAPLALAADVFDGIGQWLGLLAFLLVLWSVARRVLPAR
ncbi:MULTISPECIES: OPT family oligopeptide transporter [unclassified Herbaspirillum]|uniref:OPT family oligopeptide transporter n=1 Tax=unclassified Herbaspirillum TaxID=2624150 RepID=UPI00115370ED|nr:MULTISPECIES: oligopeptide transporter, OPT family [unclassified Herbaspirillum]MBB5393759.1 putative OPT family oligopeptide transporter [Herbaspirillum sp. SJZ102]TQK01379.1 putative OPT family oligopeptide transporter [Herbaspirillum sp. SJZ130]TQK05775.1 putative OPT family oligopeptide transporter [Herbaspirillum sp. SJZ106]